MVQYPLSAHSNPSLLQETHQPNKIPKQFQINKNSPTKSNLFNKQSLTCDMYASQSILVSESVPKKKEKSEKDMNQTRWRD